MNQFGFEYVADFQHIHTLKCYNSANHCIRLHHPMMKSSPFKMNPHGANHPGNLQILTVLSRRCSLADALLASAEEMMQFLQSHADDLHGLPSIISYTYPKNTSLQIIANSQVI